MTIFWGDLIEMKQVKSENRVKSMELLTDFEPFDELNLGGKLLFHHPQTFQKHSSALSKCRAVPFVDVEDSGFDVARRTAAATECTLFGRFDPRGVGRRDRGVGILEAVGVPILLNA